VTNSKKKFLYLAVLASSFLFFSACGGGDSSRPPSQPPQQNNPPVITSSPITEVNENRDYNYQVTAQDSDGDQLTYSLVEKPDWLSISNRTISGIAPEVLEDEDFSVKVKVSDGKTSVEQTYTLTVKNISNTHVLTTEDLSQLSSVQDDSLIFSNPVDVSPQDILVAGISDVTPEGFLREVTSLSSDKKIINTQQASLEQTIENASFFYQTSLYPSSVSSFSGKRGVSELYASRGFNFSITLDDVLIYDADGNPNTTFDQISFGGEFLFNLDFSLDFDISRRQINKIDFRNIIDARADVTVNISPFIDFMSHEVRIANYIFNPIVAYIPPGIPLVIIPELELCAGVAGRVDAEVVNVVFMHYLAPGLVYENNQWNPISSFLNNFEFSFLGPQRTNFSYKAYIGPRLNLFLYGITGPYGEANAYLEISSALNNWKLYGGLEALLGVKARIFSKALFDYSEKVIDFKKLLAEGGDGPITDEKILFVSGPEYPIYDIPQIYTINEDGSDLQQITNFEYHTYSDFEPRASPDGSKIVFVSKPIGEIETEIYTMDLDTGNITRLTNNSYEDIYPDWSPDGNKIAFVSDRIGGGDRNIYIMNSDGSNPQRLNLPSELLNHGPPRWSPDGQKIAFDATETGSDYDVYVVNNDGSGLNKLVNSNYLDIEPSWSSDGSKLAFTSSRDGNREIYIINSNGTNEERLTNNLAIDAQPSWSPDGNRIVFVSDRFNGYNNLHIMNSNGSGATRIVTIENNIDRTPSYLVLRR
jgi:hypothetical protein